MRYIKLATIVTSLFLLSCTESNKPKVAADSAKVSKPLQPSVKKNDDIKEIQTLIRNMLKWGESKNSFQVVPVLTDSKDSVCTGFDLKTLETNLEKLRETTFFSTEFIDNYNQIILTLDKKMKNKEFDEWSTGELPPFNFANDVDPWCDCQDVPYDTPDAFSLVEVHAVTLNKEDGELYWKWGKLGADASKDWKDFSYKFKVKKENGKWQISYLEGFDFDVGTKI